MIRKPIPKLHWCPSPSLLPPNPHHQVTMQERIQPYRKPQAHLLILEKQLKTVAVGGWNPDFPFASPLLVEKLHAQICLSLLRWPKGFLATDAERTWVSLALSPPYCHCSKFSFLMALSKQYQQIKSKEE